MVYSDASKVNPKIPPHSEEAETSVLGAMLLDKDSIISVAEFLDSKDFYDDRHRVIYEAMVSLYEDRVPIDILTLSEKLKKKKEFKNIGGASYLADLTAVVPSAAHVEHYGKIVKNLATKRQLLSASSKLSEMSFDEGVSAEDLLDRAESEIFSLSQKHLAKSFTSVRSALEESFDRLDELHKRADGLRGVPTGYKDLDDHLAGFQASNLLILAARPGVGKTTLALNIAQNVAVKYKKNVGFFSLEMSKEELVDRLLVAQADIDAWKLKTGKLSEADFTSLSNAMGVLAEAPIYIDDTPALSILEMRTKARRLQVEHGLDLVIVDYLQLARSRQLENRVQEVSEISQGLKNLARELKVPVLTISQLSRAVEQRGGPKRPQLSDLRESGCLSGDTKIVLSDTGERIEIAKLSGRKNINILAVDKNMKLVKAKTNKVFPSGKKVIYKLNLRSGKIIKASGNHPFMKIDGWTRLEYLKIGDRVATPNSLSVVDIKVGKDINRDKIIVLAHLIGDGCYVKRQPLHYTNSEMGLITVVKRSAVCEFNIKPRIVQQENWYHLYLASPEKLARGKRNPIVRWLDEELGIYGQHSREKVIPNIIFQMPRKYIELFLKHLWSTDGCVYLGENMGAMKNKSKVTLYYATGSRIMAEQVSHLLLRIGILSTVSLSKKKGYGVVYNVHIQGKTQQLMYLKTVGFIGNKHRKANDAIKYLESIEENPNTDVIPKEIWSYIEKLRRDTNISTREFHKRMGWAYSGTQRHGNGISKARLKKIVRVFNDEKLRHLSTSDLYWDEVKSIEKIGVGEVFDIEVPKYANFVANDIVVHNSIEQDADVVMFLWREDEENLQNFQLDIAKHRNGPIGNIKLFFKGDRIKFYEKDMKR